jgi:hypothetical protein
LDRVVRASKGLDIVLMDEPGNGPRPDLIGRPAKFAREGLVCGNEAALKIAAINESGAAGPSTEQSLWRRVGRCPRGSITNHN